MFGFIKKLFTTPIADDSSDDRVETEEEFSTVENEYLNLLDNILTFGTVKTDRTGTGTYSLHGQSVTYDLRDEFPRFTTKFVAMKTAIAEMICFIQGATNVEAFHQLNCHVWDEFADETGDLGPIYGAQWRNWQTSIGTSIDQLYGLCQLLQKKPNSRRLIVSAWNPEFLSDESIAPSSNPKLGLMSLSPCHKDFQLLTRPAEDFYDFGDNNRPYLPEGLSTEQEILDALSKKEITMLDMVVSIRSNDMFLGHPFNAVQYAYLLCWFCHCFNMVPGKLTIHIGDAHIYLDHVTQVHEQLSRVAYRAPTLTFPGIARTPKSFFDMRIGNHLCSAYRHHPKIAAPIAVHAKETNPK